MFIRTLEVLTKHTLHVTPGMNSPFRQAFDPHACRPDLHRGQEVYCGRSQERHCRQATSPSRRRPTQSAYAHESSSRITKDLHRRTSTHDHHRRHYEDSSHSRPRHQGTTSTHKMVASTHHMESPPRATTKRASKHRSGYTKELENLNAILDGLNELSILM